MINKKQTEDEISDRCILLNNIINSIPYPFYVVDVNSYKIKFTNKASGFEAADLEEQTCFALTHNCTQPCNEKNQLCPITEVKRSKKPVVVEHMHKNSDGEERLFEVSAIPLFDKDNQVTAIIESNIDVTEQRQTEEALKESEWNLRRAQRISRMGNWYYNWIGETEVWSDECFELFGINKDEYPDNVVPESLSLSLYANPEETEELGTSLAEKQDTYELEYTTVPIDGQVKIIHSYCEVERDTSGNILKIFGTDHDITERIEAENKLKESHSELSALYTLSSVINESTTMDSLLPRILKTVTSFEICNIEKKGGIFLIDKGKMRLAAHLGFDRDFLELHKDMKPGNCLCGLVAESGKMIITDDYSNDKRFTMQYSGMKNYGYVIVPLKSPTGIEGVLCLFTKKGTIINDRIQNLFKTIGTQVGIVIRNTKLYEETRSLSLYDPLTGLANRRMMDIHLNELLTNAKRYNNKFFVIMLDIDYFKKYNDKFGHEAGDLLLSEIANIFNNSIRESDLIARYGGDEFLIAVSEIPDVPVSYIAERIRKNVEDRTDVTISLGIAYYRKGLEINDLIVEADKALYKAKKQGRNRFVFSDFEDNSLRGDFQGDKNKIT